MSEVTVKTKTASALWHELLRELPLDKQREWKGRGFPYDYYDDSPCTFCKTLDREKAMHYNIANREAVAAKAMAQETLAKSAAAVARARKEAFEAAGVDKFVGLLDRQMEHETERIKAITAQTATVNLPDPAPITVTPAPVTVNPQKIILQYPDGHSVAVDEAEDE